MVCVLDAMVSASRPMISEKRKLRTLWLVLHVYLDACWIPSAVNWCADALSSTLEPGDGRVSQELFRSIQLQYKFDLSASASQRADTGFCQSDGNADEGFLERQTSTALEPTFRISPRSLVEVRVGGSMRRALSSRLADACMPRLLVLSRPQPTRPANTTSPSIETHRPINPAWSFMLAEIWLGANRPPVSKQRC